MDGLKNSGSIVDEHTWLKVILKDQAYWLQFYITNLGSDRLILGDPWLRVANPQIDWPRWAVCIGRIQTARGHLGKMEMMAFLLREKFSNTLVPIKAIDLPKRITKMMFST